MTYHVFGGMLNLAQSNPCEVAVGHSVVIVTGSHPLISLPSSLLDNIRVMVIVWRLRGNIIRTAPCWVV